MSIIILSLTACDQPEESPKATELRHYLRNIPEMEQSRLGDPLQEWDSSVEGFKKQLKLYRHRVNLIELMSPRHGELKDLHAMYVNANKQKLTAWANFLGEYEGGVLVDRMETYRTSIKEADRMLAEYYQKLRVICQERGVTVPADLPSK